MQKIVNSLSIKNKNVQKVLEYSDFATIFDWTQSTGYKTIYNYDGLRKYFENGYDESIKDKDLYKMITQTKEEYVAEQIQEVGKAYAKTKLVQDWCKYKRVYSVDKDWYDDFKDTEKIKLDFSMFERLPYTNFYIDLANVGVEKTAEYPGIQGCFIRVDKTENRNAIIIGLVNKKVDFVEKEYAIIDGKLQETDKESVIYGDNSINCDIYIIDKDRLESDTEFVKRSNLINAFNWNRDGEANNPYVSVKANSKPMHDIIMFILQFLYFLSSKTDDILEVENKNETIKYNNKIEPIKKWVVGTRYGEKIRRLERKRKLYGDACLFGSSNIDKSRPRPHTRSAHWHHYWCGSKENKHLELRWLEPTFVNGTIDDIITTINQCSDEDLKTSNGEHIIEQYLEKMGIHFEREYTVEIKGHKRRYDFRVYYKTKVCFIEFDGEQHFKSVEQFGGIEEYKKRQIADRDKNKYAKQNKTLLLRIRYDQIAEIPDLIDKFLDNGKVGELNPVLTERKYYSICK